MVQWLKTLSQSARKLTAQVQGPSALQWNEAPLFAPVPSHGQFESIQMRVDKWWEDNSVPYASAYSDLGHMIVEISLNNSESLPDWTGETYIFAFILK